MTSVALVVLDTLRKDYFDKYFDWLPGTRYNQAWSPSHRTPPVHGALFCGRYPSELGFDVNQDRLQCPEPTLAESLSDAGYETTAFSANPYITEHFDFDRGFQSFNSPWQLDGLSDEIFDWRDAASDTDKDGASMYARLIKQLISSEQKMSSSLLYGLRLFLNNRGLLGVNDDGISEAIEFTANREFPEDSFLFMNFMEAHEPYLPPQSHRSTNMHDQPTTVEMTVQGFDIDGEEVRTAYEDSVRYLSDKYRDLFDSLTESFDVIITCADHGELLGRDGMWGHFYGVYPELTNVPLVVWNGETESEQSESVVSLLDAHSTILEAAGVERSSRGSSLLGSCDGGTYLSQSFGISEDRLENLDQSSIETSNETRFTTELTALASPKNYYRYETPEGVVQNGTSIHEDPTSVQDDLESDLNHTTENNELGLSESVESKLDELGYL